MLATVHSFSRSRSCARTTSLSVGGGLELSEFEFVSGTISVDEFVLLLAELFVFELLLETTTVLAFFTIRGINSTAATVNPTKNKNNTPSIPTTNGQRLRFVAPSGATYEGG